MVSLVRRVFECCKDVLAFEVGIILQNLLVGSPGAEKLQNVGDSYPHAANARPPAAFVWLNRDSLKKLGVHRAVILPPKLQGIKLPDDPDFFRGLRADAGHQTYFSEISTR